MNNDYVLTMRAVSRDMVVAVLKSGEIVVRTLYATCDDDKSLHSVDSVFIKRRYRDSEPVPDHQNMPLLAASKEQDRIAHLQTANIGLVINLYTLLGKHLYSVGVASEERGLFGLESNRLNDLSMALSGGFLAASNEDAVVVWNVKNGHRFGAKLRIFSPG